MAGRNRIDRELQTLTIGHVVNGVLTVQDVVELAGDIPELRAMRLVDLLNARFPPDTTDHIMRTLKREWSSTAAMNVSWLFHRSAGRRRRILFGNLVAGEGHPLFVPLVPGATG